MRLINVLVVAGVCIGLLACGSTVESIELTLVQYNVGVFDKYEGSSFDAVARAVKEMGADVVSLNEVDSCAMRTAGVDQIAAFAAEMGDWNYFYASAMPFNGGAYGVGVVSAPDLEIIRTNKIALPRLDGREPRAVAVVEYKDFVFASTHLDLTKQSQIGQVETINHYIDSLYAGKGKPVFLGGDFNCKPDGETIRLMKESWTQLTPDSFSFPSHAPDRCIDYIFVRPRGNNVKVVSAEIPVSLQTADLATASDHLPVVLSVAIGPGR